MIQLFLLPIFGSRRRQWSLQGSPLQVGVKHVVGCELDRVYDEAVTYTGAGIVLLV